MADWLAYGLEIAYADSHEIGIVRQARTNSGLIRAQVHNDPEYPDWPQAARELIAANNPRFVVMMVGINDRKPTREQAAPPQRVVKPAPEPGGKAELEHDRPAPEGPEMSAATAPGTTVPGGNRAVEFRTDAWGEAYSRRIDETIASLKTSKVPVFWVGLPPLLGEKSASDIPFLNELYRSRADKAGIVSTRMVGMFSPVPTSMARPGGCEPTMACTSPMPVPGSSPIMSSARSSAG